MGFNIGSRMIDEFLAHTSTPHCKKFDEVGQKVCEGFKLFFGVDATVNLKTKSDQVFVI